MYSKSIVRSFRDYQINLVIKILIISDFIIWSSFQLFLPIFAIFITNKIVGGTIEVVGIATALYLLSKSIFEIPVGVFIDQKKGERDDLYTSIVGTILTALVYFAYIYVDQVWQLYSLQIILGIAAAVAFPGWYSIFTRHLDKNKKAFEWSMYDVITGLGMAGAAALGGFMADQFGFNILFTVVGILTLIGAILLLVIKKRIFTK
ncbi:MAG TPA: MFS transporter [Patescibacteria group bacterium]|nr:MFS transporter [Patescibacteria group bacterium]